MCGRSVRRQERRCILAAERIYGVVDHRLRKETSVYVEKNLNLNYVVSQFLFTKEREKKSGCVRLTGFLRMRECDTSHDHRRFIRVYGRHVCGEFWHGEVADGSVQIEHR